MRKFTVIASLIMLAATALSAQAADKPTSDEVRKVLDFYNHGKGLGPVLIEAKICRDVPREGEQKFECAGEIVNETLKKGEALYLWTAYMTPSGEEPQSIIVQYENGGVTRMVKNLKVSGALRHRNWLANTFDKTGKWTIRIVHDKGDTTDVLGVHEVTVE